MNNDDYKEALFYAASIFNERLGTEFSEDNLVLRCFQTENQQEVFEQFCKQYFPDRLKTAIQRTAILTFMPLPSSVKEAALMESFCGQTLRVIRQS